MHPRGHVLVSTLAALLVRRHRPVSAWTWIASILADADHVAWHTAHSGRLDPAAAYHHFRSNPPALPASRLPLHRPAMIAAFFLLGRGSRTLHDLALGLAFHRAVDDLTDVWQVGRRAWARRQRQRLRMIVFSREQGACQRCGVTDVALELHHRIPEALGGPNHPNNLLALCPSCHDHTHGRPLRQP